MHRLFLLLMALAAPLFGQADDPKSYPMETLPPVVVPWEMGGAKFKLHTREQDSAAFPAHKIAGNVYYVGQADYAAYLITTPAGHILIDTTFEREVPLVRKSIETLGFRLADVKMILITHAHIDHIGGAARLSRELGWPVVASALTAPVVAAGDEKESGLAGAQAQGGYPPEMRMRPCPVSRVFGDGDLLELEGFSLRAIGVRGHSADSHAFLFEHLGQRCLIVGDIVFYGGVVGLINTADSSLREYGEDMGKLAGLGVDVLLPGHGLFTLEGGQRHIDVAWEQLNKGFVPRTIGQGDLIF